VKFLEEKKQVYETVLKRFIQLVQSITLKLLTLHNWNLVIR